MKLGENKPPAAEPHEQRSSSLSLPLSLRFDGGQGILSLDEPLEGAPRIERLEMEIPDLTFPFDLSGGTKSLRDRWLKVARLDISACLDDVPRAGQGHSPVPGLRDVELALCDGALEAVGRIDDGSGQTQFIVRYLPDVIEDRELVLRPSVMLLLGPPCLPATVVAAKLCESFEPIVERIGIDAAIGDIPARALRRMLPPSGYRVPDHRSLSLLSLTLAGRRGSLSFSNDLRPRAVAGAEAMALTEATRLAREGDALPVWATSNHRVLARRGCFVAVQEETVVGE